MDYQWSNNIRAIIYDVKITVQPTKSMRFRYESEKTAARFYGENHSNENPIYPTIKIDNYDGRVFIRISCVTKDENRPHPHNLVKIKKDSQTETCHDGIFEVDVQNSSNGITFQNLGLHCVKKGDIRRVLEMRKRHRVDPFGMGFDHQITSADLHCIRLCFEVFIGTRVQPYIKLVSDLITDAKDLVIYKISYASGSVNGKEEILMFCEKIAKSDGIKIRFFEESNNEIVWHSYAEFEPTDVHKQYGIAFKTPKYTRNLHITEPVEVKIELVRNDGAVSAPRKFLYKPNETDIDMKKKRQRLDQSSLEQPPQLSNYLSRPNLQPNFNDATQLIINIQKSYKDFGLQSLHGPLHPSILDPSRPYSINSDFTLPPNIPPDQNILLPIIQTNANEAFYQDTNIAGPSNRSTNSLSSQNILDPSSSHHTNLHTIQPQKPNIQSYTNEQIQPMVNVEFEQIESDEVNQLDSDELIHFLLRD